MATKTTVTIEGLHYHLWQESEHGDSARRLPRPFKQRRTANRHRDQLAAESSLRVRVAECWRTCTYTEGD